MTQRSKMIAIAAILGLVALGALFRNPIRKSSWFRSKSDKIVPHAGRFDNPEAVAIDAEGTVYVGCQNTGKFIVLDKTGKTLKEWTALEGYHNGAGAPSGFCRGLYIVVPEP